MKKFISKNWKIIIFIFAGLAILINLIKVSITPATIVEDYYKYGPTYTYEVPIDLELEENLDIASESVATQTGSDQNTGKTIIIFGVLLCLILILGNIMDGSSAPAKKK